MKYFSLMLGLAICASAVSCSSDKTTEKDSEGDATVEMSEADATPVVLAGEWTLSEYAGPDGPVAVDSAYVITFNPADSTFSMQTDCNIINGRYVQNGDSIAFVDMLTTRMMGPEMVIDDTFNAMLPTIETVVVTDSTFTLQNSGNNMATFAKK